MYIGSLLFRYEYAIKNTLGENWILFLRCFKDPLIFSSATTGDVWIIPSFQIWGYNLHVEHVSFAITNCGQHQWVIPSPISIALKALLEENITRILLFLSLDLFFKILLIQIEFLGFFYITIFPLYFLLIGLLLQYIALFSRVLVKV